MEELIFLLNMKIWSNIDTSPSKPLCRTCPLYIGLFYKMPTGFAGSSADISSFSFPPLLQRLVIKHLWQMFSQPCMFTEWSRQAKSFLFLFFFYSPACVCACVCEFSAGWPDPEHVEEEGWSSACHIACCKCKCQSQCTPKFQLSCSIYRLSC